VIIWDKQQAGVKKLFTKALSLFEKTTYPSFQFVADELAGRIVINLKKKEHGACKRKW
jgi:hypothetical protein